MATKIVLMPISKFDRKRDAEFIENSAASKELIQNLKKKGAYILTLSDFMDLCNNQELNLEQYWITYINY